MRTAVISDLHLGLLSGGDVARDPDVRRILLDELAGADRVVLLGDVVELREHSIGASLESARPFFEELGAAIGEREVTLVPGNHDHRFAEPLLDQLALDDTPLGLEHHADPSPGPTALIATWLGPAKQRLAAILDQPARGNVYATHGHYLDPPPTPAAGRVRGRRHGSSGSPGRCPARRSRRLQARAAAIPGSACAAQGRRPQRRPNTAGRRQTAWRTLAGVAKPRSRRSSAPRRRARLPGRDPQPQPPALRSDFESATSRPR
jgi:hypothetical protein